MNEPMLAATLDGRVIVLDTKNARVVLMDAQSERVWRSCRGLTEKEIATHLGEAPLSVQSTLLDLVVAGLVIREQDRWTQADVAWV
jgi:predicted Rossmann fold nucleotide-binding protein DprA/Smf involved in DNA uptake